MGELESETCDDWVEINDSEFEQEIGESIIVTCTQVKDHPGIHIAVVTGLKGEASIEAIITWRRT